MWNLPAHPLRVWKRRTVSASKIARAVRTPGDQREQTIPDIGENETTENRSILHPAFTCEAASAAAGIRFKSFREHQALYRPNQAQRN